MKVLVVGANGMIGRKLVEQIAASAALGGRSVAELILVDMVSPKAPESSVIATQHIAADLSTPSTATKLIAYRPDVIIHLAAIVSGEAEADFTKGYRVNLDGTRLLFEAIAAQPDYCPRVVFSSSLAVFGAPFPAQIPDDFHLTPLSSYGIQKAMGELLLNDYSRKGFLDGIGLRLPTICVRPGKPNKAASSFYSSIIREPLNGQEAVLPVDRSLRHWFASPRSAVGFITHASGLDTSELGAQRNLTMTGLSATIEEQIEALRRVAGSDAVSLIREEADPAIAAIVGNWPEDFTATKARELGFVAETSFDEIIQVYLEDEMRA